MKNEGKALGVILTVMGLLLSLTLAPASAFVPETINYQGYLTNTAGTPVNGMVQIVFSIYDSPSGKTALWSELQNVSANDGIYSVILGTGTPILGKLGALSFDQQYYLGIKVGVDIEMEPRQLLSTVPYSFRSQTVENVGPHSHDAGDITSGSLNLSGSTATGNSAIIEGMNSGAGYGVKGWSLSNFGVYGYSSSVPGVYGYSASNAGVGGTNGSTGNYGLLGTNDYGVYGESYSANGYAGYFTGRTRVTGNLLVDGSVGIGTPTPAEKLEIKSTSSAYIVVDRGTDQLGGIAYREKGETQWIFPFIRGWQSDNLIVRDEKYLIDTMVFQAQTGNVGIGIAGGLLPTAKLDVNGEIRIRDNALIFTDPSGTPYPENWIGKVDNIEGTKKWLHIGGITDSGTGGDNLRRLAFFADKNYFYGSVAIGKVTPSERLDVNGNAKVSGNLYVGGSVSVPTRTQTYNVSPLDFRPLNSGTDHAVWSHGLYLNFLLPPPDPIFPFYAPVRLPDGATIKKVSIWFTDTNSEKDMSFRLMRVNPTTGTEEQLTLLTSSGGGSYVSADNINSVVNNFLYAYYFEVNFYANGSATTFRAAQIDYQYTRID
jgi:hypothetical protein